ncbi:MAG: hypothetical protein QM758_06910 [Armatimonas sp.]
MVQVQVQLAPAISAQIYDLSELPLIVFVPGIKKTMRRVDSVGVFVSPGYLRVAIHPVLHAHTGYFARRFSHRGLEMIHQAQQNVGWPGRRGPRAQGMTHRAQIDLQIEKRHRWKVARNTEFVQQTRFRHVLCKEQPGKALQA